MQQLKALWLRPHSQAMSLGKETMIFGLLQDVGNSACQAGQEMCCLVSPACTVALQHPDGVGLLILSRGIPLHEGCCVPVFRSLL